MSDAAKNTLAKKFSGDTDLIILKRCSYFGKGGLVVLELGGQKVPSEYADALLKKGVARKPDGFVSK